MHYRMRRLIILMILIAIGLITPRLVSLGYVNQGSQILLHALMSPATEERRYPYWRLETEEVRLAEAKHAFELARRFDSSNSTAAWGEGRAALAGGWVEEAARALPIETVIHEESVTQSLNARIAGGCTYLLVWL